MTYKKPAIFWENQPDISFSRSNMALVASICSQLTWLFWHWESSPLGKVPPSLPLALVAPPDSLNVVFSFLFKRVLKWRQAEPSEVSPQTAPFWPKRGDTSGWGGSSSLVVLLMDSWERDLLSPLNIILKWVRGLSESSVLSSEQVPADRGSCSGSASSTCSGTGSYSETIIVGIAAPGTPLLFPEEVPGFSGGSVDSGFKEGLSFTPSVWGLELCGERCDNEPEGEAAASRPQQDVPAVMCSRTRGLRRKAWWRPFPSEQSAACPACKTRRSDPDDNRQHAAENYRQCSCGSHLTRVQLIEQACALLTLPHLPQ